MFVNKIIAGFLAGVLWKVWDDVTDNNYLPATSLKTEFIKTLMIILCTIYFMLDVFVAFMFIVIVIPLNAVTKGIDHNVWVSLSLLPFITLPFSWQNISTLSLHWELKGIAMIIYLIAMTIDHFCYPEETSTRKSVGRFITMIVLSVLVVTIIITPYFDMLLFLVPFTCFSIGYLVANLVFHAWVFTNNEILI